MFREAVLVACGIPWQIQFRVGFHVLLASLFIMQPSIPLDLFAKRAQRWLMFSSLSTIPPMRNHLCRAEMGHPQKCCAGDLQAEGGQCLYHWRCHCGMQGRARVLKGVRALQKNIVQGTVEMCEAHPRMPGGRPKGGRMGWVHLDGEGSSMERAKENHGLKGNFMLERMSGGPQ